MVQESFSILLLCAMLIKITLPDSKEICETTISRQWGVKWFTTTTKTSSQPLCSNKAKELACRECSNGQWGPEPECSYIQDTTPPQCPNGFLETEDICFILTTKTTFPPSCPFNYTLPYYSYINAVANITKEPVWMPVTRDLSNGLGFLQWVELGFLYKSTYKDSYAYYSGIEGKDCLISYDGGSTKRAVSCDDEYRGVCAYSKLTKSRCAFADDCWQSDYSSRNACFCYSTTSEETEAEFLQPYQNSLYHLLTDETCTIGLRRTANTFVWSNSGEEISYTYWSPEVVFDDGYTFGAFSPSGWILTEEKQQCSLVKKSNPPSPLKLNLTYNADENSFTLEISDLDASVFCFTNTNTSSIVYRYPQLLKDMSKYKFYLSDYDSGYYWCEGFNLYDFEVVQTEKVLIGNKNFEFVTIFEVEYDRYSFNPLSPDTTYYLNEILLSKFTSHRSDYTPRFIKIVEIWERAHLMWVNIHFISNNRVRSSALEWEYARLKQQLYKILNLYRNDLLSLRNIYSSDYCFSESANSLTWPITPIREVATPKEFCFTVRGQIISRSCGGNFVDGAKWSDVDKCKLLESSFITKKLLKLYNEEVDVNSQSVSAFFARYPIHFFNALDVYLLRRVLNVAYNIEEDIDIISFTKNINSILYIDKSKLLESQVTARATDSILYLIYSIIMKLNIDPIKIVKENFTFIQNFSSNITGIIVKQYENQQFISELTGYWSLQKIKKERNVVSAIWLSPELKAQITNDTKITFTFYSNDGFFSETATTTNTVTSIFGVYIGNDFLETALPGPVNVYQKIDSDDKMKRTCSFWSYDINRQGFWFRDGNHTFEDQNHLCQFWRHTSNLAVVASNNEFIESNITHNLVDLIENDYLTSDRVDMLANISEKYDEFVPMDIFLFGKVLEVVNDTQTDLRALTKSVGNLQKTSRPVLFQSQNEKQATDNILCYIDDIVRNNNTTSEITYQSENFVLVVSNIRKNDFGGVIVLKKNESLDVQILRGSLNLDNITQFDNIESAVIISRELRTQLLDDPQIFITIFFNDNLFNANTTNHEYISTIYGVTIPQIGNYSGPISIFHNISGMEDYDLDCSHWNYQESNQNSSFWESNDKANNLESLVQCDFWHTTHFALLLLDRELYPLDAKILEWITYINTGVSFFGLFGIILTAILFKKWRKNIGNQILFNFTVAITLQIIAFYGVAAFDTDSMLNCTFLGSLLHYSIIAQFCWMFVIAVLQFRRFVKVFATSPTFLLLKTCLFGWGVPLIAVAISLIIDNNNYTKSMFGFCYPSGLGLYLGIWAPILIVIGSNLCIFAYIMYNVIQRNIEPSMPCKNDGKYQWRLFVLLFFMLGMTWTFGFLANFGFGVIFAYLFCLTATLQGFVLFLYFIVLNSNTRYLYTHAIKSYCLKKNN